VEAKKEVQLPDPMNGKEPTNIDNRVTSLTAIEFPHTSLLHIWARVLGRE
jgi:hypothetical protein